MCSFQGAHDIRISALIALTLRLSEEMVASYHAVLKVSHDRGAPLRCFAMWFTVLTRSGYFFRHRLAPISRSRTPLTVNLTKRNKTPPTFVPKREPHALEALKQRKSAHAAKFGMLTEHPGQTVIRNTAAQVMDMVDADVRREPAQDSRKVVVGTAMQSRFLKAPPVLMRPECPLELMLHVEQPYSR
jgi:hypothetical protein